MKFLNSIFAATLLSLGQCSAIPVDAKSPVADALILRPIAIRDYEAATGLQRRDSEDFKDLDPAEQAQLIYGSPGCE